MYGLIKCIIRSVVQLYKETDWISHCKIPECYCEEECRKYLFVLFLTDNFNPVPFLVVIIFYSEKCYIIITKMAVSLELENKSISTFINFSPIFQHYTVQFRTHFFQTVEQNIQVKVQSSHSVWSVLGTYICIFSAVAIYPASRTNSTRANTMRMSLFVCACNIIFNTTRG